MKHSHFIISYFFLLPRIALCCPAPPPPHAYLLIQVFLKFSHFVTFLQLSVIFLKKKPPFIWESRTVQKKEGIKKNELRWNRKSWWRRHSNNIVVGWWLLVGVGGMLRGWARWISGTRWEFTTKQASRLCMERNKTFIEIKLYGKDLPKEQIFGLRGNWSGFSGFPCNNEKKKNIWRKIKKTRRKTGICIMYLLLSWLRFLFYSLSLSWMANAEHFTTQKKKNEQFERDSYKFKWELTIGIFIFE